MKLIKKLIKKLLQKIFEILGIGTIENQKIILQNIQDTQDLIIYGINNSIFRIQEYEDAYLEMAEILRKSSISFSLYYGALLSIIRNGYLDPNVMDIDYIVTTKDLQLIEHIFEKNEEFQIFQSFAQ